MQTDRGQTDTLTDTKTDKQVKRQTRPDTHKGTVVQRAPGGSDFYPFCENEDKIIANLLGFKPTSAGLSLTTALVRNKVSTNV